MALGNTKSAVAHENAMGGASATVASSVKVCQ